MTNSTAWPSDECWERIDTATILIVETNRDASVTQVCSRLRGQKMKLLRRIAFFGVLAIICLFVAVKPLFATGDDDDKKAEFIPTGVHITPAAAKGAQFVALNPDLPFDPRFTAGQATTTAVAPDGKTLLILTSGYNSQNFTSGPQAGKRNPAESVEYIFVYDISGAKPFKKQVLQIPNAFDGLAFHPSGKEFYVSGGPDDNVHVFVAGPNGWTEDAKSPIPLENGKTVFGISAAAAGIAITADGARLVVANYEHDSVSIVDIARRKKISTLDLRPGGGHAGGGYPFWIAIAGNETAFVTSERDREVVVVDIAKESPAIIDRIPLAGQPIRLLLNKSQTRLLVAEGSRDSVAVIDTKSHKLLREINTVAPREVFENRGRYKGATPNSLALSPDERVLYVTNAGANDVAVIALGDDDEVGGKTQKSQVVGLIPTGWYPNSVSVSRDDKMLYVVNGKSNAGANPRACRNAVTRERTGGTAAEPPCSAANQYVWQLTKAGFLTLPVPARAELQRQTKIAAHNNRYDRSKENAAAEQVIAQVRKSVQHVVYIVKENRTYDQILGDLRKGNGDPSINVYPQAITPNQHALADQFVDLDNFYDSGESSGDGWGWSTSGRTSDTVEKTEPVNYADRGLAYDYEGPNRDVNVGLATLAERKAANPLTPDDANVLPGTHDVSEVDGPVDDAGAGYIWDSALRAGLKVRNYGFFLDLLRYEKAAGQWQIPLLADPHASATQVAYAARASLQSVTDPYFRGFDTGFPDFYRTNEWLREFKQFEENGDFPNLELVRVMEDHTGSFDDPGKFGVNTPELQTADNDYAVGRIVEAISKSPRYKDNTLIFIVEDDSQDGPDHVDAHRSIAFVAGQSVKHGVVISKKYTTVSMISTIVGILGIEHLGLNDAEAEPMAEVFTTTAQSWTFDSAVPEILKGSQLPLNPGVANASSALNAPAAYHRPLHDAAWWEEKTKGFDFSAEDKIDAGKYNLILWQGLVGDATPYPVERSGRDLRRHRAKLLSDYRKHHPSAAGPATPVP
jgi:DNA-binding beta-propeller fold protein YncE